MATTTNYGWTTPDDTALVKDGASAIRSLGTSVDTTTKNLNPSTTLGDIEYRSSTANTNTRLGIGSTGTVLTVAGGVPSWVAPVQKVLQVVSATTTTATTITTTTLSDTSITATITPTSATSTILILISGNCIHSRGANNTGIGADLRRNSTTIANYNANNYDLDLMQATGATFTLRNFNAGITYLDSPATTSAITYKLRAQVNNNANSGTSTWQFSSTPSTITLLEIGA